ncbi:type II toxin-antitoxin system RelE/ParE family toxin [Bradyrhizobium sp. Arg314]
MRRVKVTYRPQAISDLQGIYRIIAEASQSDVVASGFVQRIMARCRKIGDVPNGGRPRDDLEPGLRTVSFERTALIAYRVADTAEVTNIFYGGRDYESLYRSDESE